MIESVVAVFVCGEEIFTIRRQESMKVFPGYRAFPGGKIDRDESDTPFETEYLKDYPPRIMRALCRELREELSFDLEEAIKDKAVRGFHYIGLAKPPVSAIGRFTAHHFKIVLHQKPPFRADPEEAAKSGWMPARELWDQYARGKMLGVIPTLRVIEKLAEEISTTGIDPLNVVCDGEKEVPVLELIRGIYFLFVVSQPGKKPVYSNSILLGDPPFIVDPSPGSREELEKLVYSIRPFKVKGILLTHYRREHFRFTGELAGRLNLQVASTPQTRSHISGEYGPLFLRGSR